MTENRIGHQTDLFMLGRIGPSFICPEFPFSRPVFILLHKWFSAHRFFSLPPFFSALLVCFFSPAQLAATFRKTWTGIYQAHNCFASPSVQADSPPSSSSARKTPLPHLSGRRRIRSLLQLEKRKKEKERKKDQRGGRRVYQKNLANRDGREWRRRHLQWKDLK